MPARKTAKTQDQRSERARSKLIRAAVTSFARYGYDGVSIREIARSAGQNSASIAYHFGDKAGLYEAVLAEVLGFVRQHAAAVETDYRDAVTHGTLSPELAESLLRRLHRDMFLGVFGGDEALRFALIFVREQVQPTPGRANINTAGAEALHRMVTHIFAAAIGDMPDSPAMMIRAHSLFGQLQIFVMARALLLQRTGWKKFSDKERTEILTVLSENLDLLLAGLRKTTATPASTEPKSLST